MRGLARAEIKFQSNILFSPFELRSYRLQFINAAIKCCISKVQQLHKYSVKKK